MRRSGVLVEAANEAPFPEDSWVGCVLRIGGARMRVDKRDGRCVVITIDPVTTERNPDFLDPALSYTVNGWEPMWLVYTPPVTYKRAEGEEGTEPDRDRRNGSGEESAGQGGEQHRLLRGSQEIPYGFHGSILRLVTPWSRSVEPDAHEILTRTGALLTGCSQRRHQTRFRGS